ncbi:MAG: NAD(P)-dependent alcohol dehydrogenase [Paracoccaceae bacterium]|nr:NAD(P)-dependent alcohol dehydrogenase [Paracoccaceae bacterium]
MKAAVYKTYGPADVVRIETREKPGPAATELLVRVKATTVTTADWRLRASAFPGGMWLPGRLMTGLFKPRNQVLGVEFAGVVEETGAQVTGFHLGDRVFGFAGHGAHAEYLTIDETAAVAPIPAGLDAAEATALPFGAVSALVFLRDTARIKPGQDALIIGASGNVGIYAVQIAKAMGATVTAVASAGNHAMLRELGADEVIDYRAEDPVSGGRRYDVIFETVGVIKFGAARKALKNNGLFVPLNFSILDALQGLWSQFRGGRKMLISVNGDKREDLDSLAEMITAGTLKPVIDTVLPLERIRDAYRYVEGRHRKGSVVIEVAKRAKLALAG